MLSTHLIVIVHQLTNQTTVAIHAFRSLTGLIVSEVHTAYPEMVHVNAPALNKNAMTAQQTDLQMHSNKTIHILAQLEIFQLDLKKMPLIFNGMKNACGKLPVCQESN